MNAETPQPEQPAGTAVPVEAPSSKGLVNPTLSGTLASDHAALENDLVQAQELAADFQRQLAGKSNDYAQLKQILEKTQADLAHFQEGIVELRAERHRLANEAMRATAFELKLTKMTTDRDRLRGEMEVVRTALERKIEEQTGQLRDRDRRVAELVIETVRLRQALEKARGGGAAPPRPVTVEAMDADHAPDIEIMPEAPPTRRAIR
jgi:hypothetical protein